MRKILETFLNKQLYGQRNKRRSREQQKLCDMKDSKKLK